MYKHFDEPLFDYIIIKETGKFSSEGLVLIMRMKVKQFFVVI